MEHLVLWHKEALIEKLREGTHRVLTQGNSDRETSRRNPWCYDRRSTVRETSGRDPWFCDTKKHCEKHRVEFPGVMTHRRRDRKIEKESLLL
jgi:hypothetical protein